MQQGSAVEILKDAGKIMGFLPGITAYLGAEDKKKGPESLPAPQKDMLIDLRDHGNLRLEIFLKKELDFVYICLYLFRNFI